MNISTEIKTSTLVILILSAVGFFLLSSYITFIALNSEFLEIGTFLLGIFFGILGLISVLSILRLNKYEFDGEKLIIGSVFRVKKKSISAKNFKSYNEIEKENKSGKWKDLTIFTEKQKIRISSAAISNYAELKTALINGLERNEYSERIWAYMAIKYLGISFTIIGLLFLFGVIKIYVRKDFEILANELITIRATLAETPKITRSKSSREIDLKLVEYPEFDFEIYGIRFSASNSNAIVNDLEIHDKIELDILKDAYDKKIRKTEDLSFGDKFANYHIIGVNGLRKDGRTFLELKDINRERRDDSSGFGFWIFFFIGLLITLSGIYLLSRKKPTRNEG